MIDKRLKDKNWRIGHLYKIIDKHSNLVTFKRNNVQRMFDDQKHSRNIILKARQLGITTEACIDMLDDVLFNNNFNAVIIAHEKDAVLKIFKKIKLAWGNFDEDLRLMIGWKSDTDRVNELSFNNGSTIRVALSSRADTVNRLHVSEFGKICAKYPLKAEEIISGAFPSVPEGGRIDVESTAEGEFGIFYNMFWEAWNKSSIETTKEFKAHFFPWTLADEYQLDGVFDLANWMKIYQSKHSLTDKQANWYFFEHKLLKDKMAQENPTTPEEAFLASGHKLFDMEAIQLQKQYIKDGIQINDWIQYDQYKSSHNYAIGADVAEGVGQDSSTAVIFDFTDNKVVAEFASNTITPDMFGYELISWANKYGGCLIAPERNNHGHATLAILKQKSARLYYQENRTKLVNESTERPGWLTTGTTKPLMLFDLNDALNENSIKVVSKFILEELRTYDKEDVRSVRFNDKQTKHWDRVIALAIVWQMRKYVRANKFNKKIHIKYDDLGRPTIEKRVDEWLKVG